MKEIRLFALILLTLPLLANAQSTKRFWHDGALSTKDFPVQGESHLSWYLGYTKVKEKADGVYYTYYKAIAYMLPFSSALTSETDLPKMQALFDRLELHRRELQQQLNEAESSDEFGDLLKAARSRMSADEASPTLTSSEGALTTIEASPIPRFTDRIFRFGIGIGTMSGYPLLFDGVANVELAWNRHVAMSDAHYGIDLDRSLVSATLGYGYTVYENSHVRITPYVAQGIGFSSVVTQGDTLKSATWVPQLGVSLDIPFYTHIITQSGNSGPFSFLTSNHSLYCIRMTTCFRHIDWGDAGNGWTANFGIGLSFLGKNTRPARNQ